MRIFVKSFLSLVLLMTVAIGANAQSKVRPHDEITPKPTVDIPLEEGVYEATEESLSGWDCPDWFRDAKFGIWAHWGPQCVAEYGDWYARGMYIRGDGQYNYHVATYGNPSVYGFKEMCRDFTADNWNPDELIKLYSEAGAQYFMALGNHHDNFDMWNSPYQEWNTWNIGMQRDVFGEWTEACKKYGLKVGISMHAAHTWMWMEPSQDFDGNLTKDEGTGKWWEGYDPQELYAQRHQRETVGGWHWEWDGSSKPDMPYMMKFQNRVLQCVNDYNPDMIYFDDSVLPFWYYNNQIGLNILQHFYNHSAAQHDGEQQVVVCGKILSDQHKKFMLWDVERGIPDRCQDEPWQTCTCIGSWHYDRPLYQRNGYKSAGQVICMLVDVVSKNGNLLLSIPVRGNGEIDEKERTVVNGIKAWMDINKESIYGTRPWKTYGEGPLAEAANPLNAQGFNEGISYSNRDVRYNEKDGTVYATIMAWPAAGKFTFEAFGIASETFSGKVNSVKLLGYGDVPFTHEGKGLTVEIPSTHPNDIAPVFAITFDESFSQYDALQELIGVVEDQTQATMIGVNTGKYTQESVDKIKAKAEEAKAVDASAGDEAIAQAIEVLRNAYNDFVKNGKVPGGNLGTHGKNVTEEFLVEASGFSRSDGRTTRFGTPQYWTVENFSIPQTNGNGTKNGIDKYPGTNCLMMGVWQGEDGNTSSDLTKSRIYRTVTLPAGQYFFGSSFNAAYQLSDQAYIFAAETLGETVDLPATSLAYFPLNQCVSGDGIFYGIEFTLEKETEVSLGWQMDLTQGSRTQEIRIDAVRLIRRDAEGESTILQDASQPMNGVYADLTTGELKDAAAPFQAVNMGSRYGKPVNWTVENYAISSGQGTRNGIDNYPGINCLSLGIWDDLGSNAAGNDAKNMRIYRQLTLEPGTYYFGAKYETRYRMGKGYLFAAKELLETDQLETSALACHKLVNVPGGNDTWYGITFVVSETTDVYLGWQADFTGAESEQEFRVKSVCLYHYGDFEDLTQDKLVEEGPFSAVDMGSRYGTPQNWTVENYSIPNTSGTRNGIDNYPGVNCLSLGIWGDRGNNEGDGTKARIYRNIQLDSGTYYFGAAYNTVYNMSDDAFFFVSSELPETTAGIPTAETTVASLQLNTIPYFSVMDRNEKYYVTFTLTQPTELYLGWQADLTKGAGEQEFRAKNVNLLCLEKGENVEPDAVNTVETTGNKGEEWYTLGGQRVKAPKSKGVYVSKNKKIMVK